jgi:hypothetical protein
MNDFTLHIILALLLLQALYQTVRVRELCRTVDCIHDSVHFFAEAFEDFFEVIHGVECEDEVESLDENQAQIEAWDDGDSSSEE